MSSEVSLVSTPMTEAASLSPEQCALQPELRANNINEITFLATDYLNHLNEAVMVLELVPSMPDMLEDAQAWKPKTYADHFRDSDLAIGDLAIRAYDIAPDKYRLPFDLTVKAINRRIAKTVENLAPLVNEGDSIKTGVLVLEACKTIQDLIGVAAGIINGSERPSPACSASADETAVMAGGAQEAEDAEVTTMSQNDIDALFN